MRVWIGCLQCRNDGEGLWYDATEADSVSADTLHEVVANLHYHDPIAFMSETEGHEELRVFDVDEAPHPSLNREMNLSEAQCSRFP